MPAPMVLGHLTQEILDPDNRGCVKCQHGFVDDDILIADTRGRAWHLACATATLGQFTRQAENRGERYVNYYVFDSRDR